MWKLKDLLALEKFAKQWKYHMKLRVIWMDVIEDKTNFICFKRALSYNHIGICDSREFSSFLNSSLRILGRACKG